MTTEPARWLPVIPNRNTGIFLTRNGKMVVFVDVVTDWHISKYGLTHWLFGVPALPGK